MTSKLEDLQNRHAKLLRTLSQENIGLQNQLELWQAFQSDQMKLKVWFDSMNEEKSKLDLCNLKSEDIGGKISSVQVSLLMFNMLTLSFY